MTTSNKRGGLKAQSAILCGSASLLALALATGARAETAGPIAAATAADVAAAAPIAAEAAATATDSATPPPQEIVITGSHIRGVKLVGVPVTTLSQQQFNEEGATTVGDLFENIPQVTMIADSNVINGGGYVARDQNINIRNLSQKGTRTLLMVDGMRFPNQGNGGCQTDPSIIPQLAVDHVDVLTDGASAEYGSDAVAGVVNVVLKRNFEGLTTQASYNMSQDLGGAREVISALAGKNWSVAGKSGNITASVEAYTTAHISGAALPSEFTANYALHGLDDRMAFSNSNPGIASTGNPAAVTGAPASFSLSGLNCGNCYSAPKGTNGQGLTWAQFLANPGVSNEYNNFYDGWISPQQTRVALTATVTQEVSDKISFFGDAWFSDRKTVMHSQSSGLSNYALPTTYANPYTPLSAPSNLVVNVDLTGENPIVASTKELASRVDAGFNITLPFAWKAKVTASTSNIHEFNDSYGTMTKNNVIAALGGTTTAVVATPTTPAIAAFTKPSNVPYLNVFCDSTVYATCNSAATLAYVSGWSYADEQETVNEFNFTADGPLFQLPGGTVKGAVGALYTASSIAAHNLATNANSNQVINFTLPYGPNQTRYVGSAFAQLNVPIVGGDFTFPLIKRLDADIEVRYDHYNQFGETINPKAAIDWTVGWGFTLKSSIGTSFRAPSFQENGNAGAGAVNTAVGTGAANSIGTCAVVGAKAVPGTIAAIIDPNCTQALQFLGGLSLLNSAQSAAAIRPGGVNLTPEKGYSMDLGFEWAPKIDDGPVGFLNGLDVQMTYWRLRLVDKLQGYFGLAAVTSGTLDNPAYTAAFLTYANDPNFAQHVSALVNSAYSSLPSTVTAATAANPTSGVAFIADGAIRNIGWQYLDGVDLQADYKWRWHGVMGGWGAGAWNTGITGSYDNKNVTNGGPGQLDVNYYSQNNDGRFRYRAHLGWGSETNMGSGFGAILFVNYIPHFNPLTNPLPPSCFLVGNTACNASGASQFAGYTQQYTSLPTYVKDTYSWDMNLSYNTADLPKDRYLKNVRVSLSILNIFDKRPPFEYEISPPGGGAPHAFYTSTASQELSISGRSLNLTLTKEW